MAKIIKLLIGVLIGFGVILFLQSSNRPSLEPPNPFSQTKSNDQPVLYNLGVKFGDWDKANNKAGDFLFSQKILNSSQFLMVQNKILVEFGTRVYGHNQQAKLLPEMTYILPAGTKVMAPIEGLVKLDKIDWSGDYAVHITRPGSNWLVSLEHVIKPVVENGDRVKAGQVVAQVSTADLADTNFGFVELAVWKGGQSQEDIIKICPFAALADDLKPKYVKLIRSLAKDWEKFAGKDIYNQNSWALPGCVYNQLTEAEAVSGIKK
ncbi:MAG: M23 family metallopeptidase [bacterium]|nr:M23 family metallopeptidase [bacterium]